MFFLIAARSNWTLVGELVVIVTLSSLLVRIWGWINWSCQRWTTTKASEFPLSADLLTILKWMKTLWDLGILQQAFVFLCLPRWLDRLRKLRRKAPDYFMAKDHRYAAAGPVYLTGDCWMMMMMIIRMMMRMMMIGVHLVAGNTEGVSNKIKENLGGKWMSSYFIILCVNA